jgi:hypothetical protein
MIDQALIFLRDQLNRTLKSEAGNGTDDSEAERDAVVFVDGDKMEPVTFTSSAVSMLLVNIEQQKVIRSADPYRRKSADGTPQRTTRELAIDLTILFVARFKQYDQGLKALSGVIQFFQEHPSFERGEHPALAEAIDTLIVEPMTLPLAQQNEIWSALRTTYHPSVLYRVHTLVFRHRTPADAPAIAETEIDIEQRPPVLPAG